jgi:hypothetical protein
MENLMGHIFHIDLLILLFYHYSQESPLSHAALKKKRVQSSLFSTRSNVEANLANESDVVYTFRIKGELYNGIGNFEAQNHLS